MRIYNLALLTLLALTACGVEPDLDDDAPEVEDGLVIASADDRRITGTYGEHGRGLEFKLEFDASARFVTAGAYGETWLASVFFDQSAATTVLDRLTVVRTADGIEMLGDVRALDDLAAQRDASLLVPLQTALRTHGIIGEIVTLP